MDLKETYAYRTSKYLVSEKEEIKCNNKQYNKTIQKWLILVILQTKTKNNIIQVGHKFLIIHTEY